MAEIKDDLPTDKQILDTLISKADIQASLAAVHTMVVTDRETDVEIQVNGNLVYDSHRDGHRPLSEVVNLIAGAMAIHISESDYNSDDGTMPGVAQAALRIANAKNIRCWFLDRASHEDEPCDTPEMPG